jgi:hypothetical protein
MFGVKPNQMANSEKEGLSSWGESSDTRYMDKVIEKKEQYAGLCYLLAAEGYDVMLLPIVLGTAVHF